jgi:hypothetical protein
MTYLVSHSRIISRIARHAKEQTEKEKLNFFLHFLNNLLTMKPFSHSIGLRHATVKISSNSIIYSKSYWLKIEER